MQIIVNVICKHSQRIFDSACTHMIGAIDYVNKIDSLARHVHQEINQRCVLFGGTIASQGTTNVFVMT